MHNGYEKPAVAPRFMKQGVNHAPQMQPASTVQVPLPAKEELSLRPTPSAMMKNFAGPIYIPNLKSSSGNDLVPSVKPPSIIPSDAALLATKNNMDKAKSKKDQGPTKEDIAKEVEDICEEYLKSGNMEEAATSIQNLKIPEKIGAGIVTTLLNKAVDRNENEREKVFAFVVHCTQTEIVATAHFLESFRNMLELMGDLEAVIPRIKSYIANYAARAVSAGITTLAEVAEPTEGGNHYPFLLLVLQHLSKTTDKVELTKIFDDSKINLLNTLPKIDRTKERMADILEERELSFLFPLLKIQAEMSKQLQTIPDALAFFSWVQDNVNPNYHSSQGFISALMSVVVKFVTSEIKQKFGSEQSDKTTKENEKELLSKFKPVFDKFLDKVDLQIIAIYALQSTWFAMDSPKVMLLRWFINLYELEIIEEDAFLKWKEDVTDDYPGKGKALFQVNQWLLWLEQAEEDEEDEADDDPSSQ